MLTVAYTLVGVDVHCLVTVSHMFHTLLQLLFSFLQFFFLLEYYSCLLRLIFSLITFHVSRR